MNTELRKISVLMLVGTVSLGAGGCSTMGLDKDSERANERMQRETDKQQDDATGASTSTTRSHPT